MSRCRTVDVLTVLLLVGLAACGSDGRTETQPSPRVTASPLPSPTIETPAEATSSPAAPAPTPATTAGAPAVQVEDQPPGDTVTVAEVSVAAPGFVVVHRDESGVPGAVVGHAPVPAGTTADVAVVLDEPVGAGDLLWAMLHVDEGATGTYEFPGPDVPVRDADGAVVAVPFEIVD